MDQQGSMDSAYLRKIIYSLLIGVTIATTLGRIFAVEGLFDPSLYVAYPNRVWPTKLPERMPTFSSNDRSRWATIRAIVENGTFVIGQRNWDSTIEDPKGYQDTGVLFEDGYRSVDVMMNPETGAFYSTKPPLFTLVAAGEYWVLRHCLKWNFESNRWEIVCTIVITFNCLPMFLFLRALRYPIEIYCESDWGKLFVFTMACFGTFLTTFAITLNNHTVAAYVVYFAISPWLQRSLETKTILSPSMLLLLRSGFLAGLAVCLELPAASFAFALGGLIFWQFRRTKMVLIYLSSASIPLLLLFVSNYFALGDWQLGYSRFGSEWYEFPGSHWAKAKALAHPTGIDFAKEDKLTYAFHLFLGHHGLWSLTPVWFLSFIGMILSIPKLITERKKTIAGVQTRTEQNQIDPFLLTQAMILVIFVVVGLFYIFKTNNYGGWTSGPRWFFWLSPFFLISLIPIVDRLNKSRSGRQIALLFLMVSVFSSIYPVWNPWRHPWIYQIGEYYHWFRY